MGVNEPVAAIESRLREWLDEERRQAAECRDAAASYKGIDVEAEVDLRRSAARHEAIANRIGRVLYVSA